MTVTAKPSPAQAAAITFFHDGTRTAVRFNQASYDACRRNGWIEEITEFPFHRATDAGIRSIGRDTDVHLYTGLGEDSKAVCGEQVGEQTKTATSIDGTTCRACIADYNAYRAKLKVELAKFARGEAPYDQPEAAPVADPQVRRQLGMEAGDVAAVADHHLPSGYNDDPVEEGVDEAALWTPDPLPVPATAPRRAEPAPTSVQIDGRTVVFADASLVELVTVCRDESARSQHLDPHEGRRYFRARAASDAALDEIKRRLDTLHRAAAAAGPGNGLHDVLAVLDAADRRPAAGPPTT